MSTPTAAIAAPAAARRRPFFRFGLLPASLGLALPVGILGYLLLGLGHKFEVVSVIVAGVWLIVPAIIELALYFQQPVPVTRETRSLRETTVGVVVLGILIGILCFVAGRAAFVAFVYAWTYVSLTAVSGRALVEAPALISRRAPTIWLSVAWLLFVLA